jgi:hypothetical protein
MNQNVVSAAPVIERAINGGVQRVYRFPNGYGASVVRHQYSYGYDSDLWELAVTRYAPDDADERFALCYTTPITDDVLGHLSDDRVLETLAQIEALPSLEGAP